MSYLSATDDTYQQEAVEGSFARLAPASCMLLTTIKLDGTFVSTPVHGVVDGDRAYFRVWSRSGMVKRLEQADVVQVTPCSVLGWCSYPPPLDVAVRSLPSEEGRRVAGKLARKYPGQHRSLIRLLHRTCRWQMAYYELLAFDAAGEQDVGAGASGVPDGLRDQSGGYGTRRQSSAQLPPLQYGELVAQDQDLCGLPCLLTPGQPQPRGQLRDEKEGKPQAHDL